MTDDDVAVLGGGCFWCLDALFQQIAGVRQVRVGYCGGSMPDPDYASVCRGNSGHAEVVEIRFDPQLLDYERLLLCFFAAHDATALNRQGNDIGTQYRSVIFAQSERQSATAAALIRRLNAADAYAGAIVTELAPQLPFWPAESSHQDYFAKNPDQGYCSIVIAPKLAHFREVLPELLRRNRD